VSWHYLQGQEAASWDPSSSAGRPSALSRLIPTPVKSCSPGRGTGYLSHSRSGTMSARSTGGHGAEQLTLYLADSPARTSALRVAAQDLPVHVRGFGARCSESLARFGLAMSSRKTARTCVPVASAPSSKDLPAWGMTHDGVCWELGTSVRRIDGIACGSLPTPVASDHKQTGSPGELARNTPSLGAMAASLNRGEFPTPTTQGNELCQSMGKWAGHRRLWAWLEANGQFPTPTANAYGYNRGGSAGRTGKARPSLEVLGRGIDVLTLREWMMGWPIGWTALEPLETGRFRSWLRSHGAC
jgi:hypothetical protein